jgi:peptidoglycan/LPS O-acetylase OafA/YrhL
MLIFNAVMLVAIACRSTKLTRPLRSRFAKFSADLSYCLYLIHLSIYDGYMAVFRRYVSHPLTVWDISLSCGGHPDDFLDHSAVVASFSGTSRSFA